MSVHLPFFMNGADALSCVAFWHDTCEERLKSWLFEIDDSVSGYTWFCLGEHGKR